MKYKLSFLAVPLFGYLACGMGFDCGSPEAVATWDHKVNTVVSQMASQPDDPAGGILRFTIDPAEFNYGWINHNLDGTDPGTSTGLHGWFRAAVSDSGSLVCHVILAARQEGTGPSYFSYDLGTLSDSHGEWVEFYVPFSFFRYERGPCKRFTAAELTGPDRIQFLSGVGGQAPVSIDLAALAFISGKEVGEIQPRLAKARLARLLRPEGEFTGAPHPRLLLSPAEAADLRSRKKGAGGVLQAGYERLLELADQHVARIDPAMVLDKVLSYGEDKRFSGHERRAVFEGLLHPAVTPIETMAAAYRLTGDERYGRHAAACLVTMARQLTVDTPVIDEGFYYTRTFYVRALAFGYDWLQDLMTPEERQEVRTTLLGFVLDIHEQSQVGGWGRRPLHRVWNWDPGLMGACGVGMLALEGETRTAEKAIIFDCRRHLRDYLTLGVDRDGCGHEGPNYIGYGIGAGVEFAEILRRQGRGDLFTGTNYHLIAPWLIAETLPGGMRWNNLSDCGHGQSAYPVYLYANGRLAELAENDPVRPGEKIQPRDALVPEDFLSQFSEEPGKRLLSYGALAELMGWVWQRGTRTGDPGDYSGPQALAHVLFYQPCPVVENPERYLPLAMHFRGRGLVVCRTGFAADDFHLAVEAGPHAAGHDQCDKGSFTLSAYGADLAVDSGYGNDGDPMKSGSSFAHNVVLIDGQGQPMHHHNQSSGSITGFHHSSLLDWVRLDAREAWGIRYDKDWVPVPTTPVARAERSLLFVRPSPQTPGYLVVYDDIQKDDRAHTYTWQWHVPAAMEINGEVTPWQAVPRVTSFPVFRANDNNGTAEFPLRIAKAGRYKLYGLTRAGGTVIGKSDSFFFSLDDGANLTWDLTGTQIFTWSPVRDRGGTEAQVFDLTAGIHRIRVSKREPDAELARLIVIQEDTEPPVGLDATLATGQELSIAEATMGDPPFEIIPAGTAVGPDVSALVFPVHPVAGETATRWFETSREGAHPKLEYSVSADRPRFLMVMLPHTAETPVPQVTALDIPEGTGARINWGTVQDTVMLMDGGASTNECRTTAAFVRSSQNAVQDWLLLDGNRLSVNGSVLCEKDTRGIYAPGF